MYIYVETLFRRLDVELTVCVCVCDIYEYIYIYMHTTIRTQKHIYICT